MRDSCGERRPRRRTHPGPPAGESECLRQLIIQLIVFFILLNGEEYEGVIQNFLTPVSLREVFNSFPNPL